MPHIHLIASSDDFLLGERLSAVVAEVCDELGGVQAEILSDETTPESLAVELVSPSLFAPERVLVVEDARLWLGAPPPPGVKDPAAASPDPAPLVQVLAEGLPEGVGLVMGAWCGRKPAGPLLDALERGGRFEWIALPAPPKPWDDVDLSDQQRAVLEAVLARTAGGVTFAPAAVRLLLERLGFAPRLLVQEVRKLVGAAGEGGDVDEALVRSLTFPKERSLEIVRDAILKRRLTPLLDLVAAASAGVPVNDWRGQRLEPGGLEIVLHSMVANLLHQLLYLRRVAETTDLGRELAPESTSRSGWYNRRFQKILAAPLMQSLKEDAPSPVIRRGARPPSPWTVGQLFAGAGRYSDSELGDAIASSGKIEASLRSPMALEALTTWLTAVIGTRAV
jgi:hypothetical protein